VKNINFPLLFLGILLLRDSIKGANVGDAIALAAVAGLYGYKLFLESKQKVEDASLRSEVAQIRQAVDSLKIAKAMGRMTNG
jgi:hypothetical protein